MKRQYIDLMKKYLLSLIVTVAIVVLSTIPIPEDAPLGDVPLIDKWVHMVMYGGLSLMMFADHVLRSKQILTRGFFAWMLFYPIALGGLMELVQAYLTTCRSGDWIDWEADAVGALIVSFILLLLYKSLWKEKHSGQK